MRSVRVNRLRVGSFAKVIAVTQSILAFFYGAVFTLGVVAGQITNDSSVVKSLGISVTVFGLAIVIFPAVAYVIGWIQGAIAAVILNFVFKESEGLELELEDVK